MSKTEFDENIKKIKNEKRNKEKNELRGLNCIFLNFKTYCDEAKVPFPVEESKFDEVF